MPKVKSFHSVGMQQAYDLEVRHPDHQFYLANGLLTSNSHAVSYAIDSYMCAWLLTYYEAEWLCAYMETQEGQPESRAKAIRELKSFGYEIVGVDINKANDEWTILPDKKFMPSFLSVKGLGQAAVDEIKSERPYRTLDDLLWRDDGSWRHSKFNKRALEALIQLRAFDSMELVDTKASKGRTFRSYRHMWRTLIHAHEGPCKDEDGKCVVAAGGTNELKHKKKGRAELERRIKEYACDEWNASELLQMSRRLSGSSDLNLSIPEKTRDALEKLKVTCIDDWTTKGLYWFVAEEIKVKETKNGKQYLLIDASGTMGKSHKVYVWGYNPMKDGEPGLTIAEMKEQKKKKLEDAGEKRELTKKEIDEIEQRLFSKERMHKGFVAELEKTQFGFSTQAFRIKRVKERTDESQP